MDNPQKIQIIDPEKKDKKKIYPDYLSQELSFNEDEQIIIAVRKHWVVFRTPFLLTFFFPFVLIAFSMFVSDPQFHLPAFFSEKVSVGLMYICFIIFIIGFFMFIVQLFLWYRTFYIVTNQRLIKIEQENFFTHQAHHMYLDKVQDAILRIPGFQAVLYGYGNISVQGSSKTAQIEFNKVGKPKKMQQIIAKAAGKVSNLKE